MLSKEQRAEQRAEQSRAESRAEQSRVEQRKRERESCCCKCNYKYVSFQNFVFVFCSLFFSIFFIHAFT